MAIRSRLQHYKHLLNNYNFFRQARVAAFVGRRRWNVGALARRGRAGWVGFFFWGGGGGCPQAPKVRRRSEEVKAGHVVELPLALEVSVPTAGREQERGQDPWPCSFSQDLKCCRWRGVQSELLAMPARQRGRHFVLQLFLYPFAFEV